eukprot:TRINITY_DN4808_c0_g1_i1.p5 TRINITY_DN4808_c0_g1~~TRINITY_DN4808_c0_g1_i1.p5  ORF type:complete len:110 (-),score=9.48 TRINITY_DN4808_c0_g1_i1:89-418(-)
MRANFQTRSNASAREGQLGQFHVKILHGRHDLVASPTNAERIARKLKASSVMLEGAHFIVRECADEINLQLLKMIVYKDMYFISKGKKHSNPMDARVVDGLQLQDLRLV